MDPVSAYIIDQDDERREILYFLHDLILSHFPEMEAKIRYRIPFYFRKSWICYLNPVKPAGVELVFTRANELSNAQGLLDFKDRKQVAGITFTAIPDTIIESLLEVLAEAVLLDDEKKYASKRPKG